MNAPTWEKPMTIPESEPPEFSGLSSPVFSFPPVWLVGISFFPSFAEFKKTQGCTTKEYRKRK